MPTIPLLKSGQLAQYPFRRSVRQSVETVAFLDGQEQRCATTRPLHEWTIQLDLIDEQELSALEAFVEEQQGQVGKFQFTDPADGQHYENCTLGMDLLNKTLYGPGRAMTLLVIRENPD